MIKIVEAEGLWHLDQVRDLIREFVSWHRQRHTEDIALIDGYFDAKAFEAELATLPGKYTPPAGRLLLALSDKDPAGCVALRKIDAHSCEMKRMFVYRQYHGMGVGRMLAKAIIDEAKKIGYGSMKLDTSIRQIEAQGLYRSLGFTKTAPYYELPKKLEDWLVFMELKL